MKSCKELKKHTIQFVGTEAVGKLVIGPGIASEIGTELEKLTDGRVLLLVDPILHLNKIDKPILDALTENQITFDVFDEINPEPHMENMEKATEAVRSQQYGAVIGLGGGSVMDVAKLTAVAAMTDMSVEDIFANPEKLQKKLPLILMPTTSGTGSEVSPYVVASKNGTKVFIGVPLLYATKALVDPLMTKSMPPRVTAATGLDALTHGLEGVIGCTSPYTLAMAAECVKMVFEYLPRAVQNGEDIEARYYMSYAAVLGMLAYTQGGGLYAHSMSYILTAACNLPHGAGCGLALPYTLEYNKEFIKPILERMEQITNSDNVIKAIFDLVKRVAMPATLKDLNITKEQLPEMANQLVQSYYRTKNPRTMNEDEALQLLNNMYDGF